MIYAVNSHAIGYGDRENVEQFETVEDAREDFRRSVRMRRPYSIAYCYLFRSREEAESAITETEYEFDVNEDKAFEVLDFEHGYGFSFDS